MPWSNACSPLPPKTRAPNRSRYQDAGNCGLLITPLGARRNKKIRTAPPAWPFFAGEFARRAPSRCFPTRSALVGYYGTSHATPLSLRCALISACQCGTYFCASLAASGRGLTGRAIAGSPNPALGYRRIAACRFVDPVHRIGGATFGPETLSGDPDDSAVAAQACGG